MTSAVAAWSAVPIPGSRPRTSPERSGVDRARRPISVSSRIRRGVRPAYALFVPGGRAAGPLTTFVFADVEGSTTVFDRLGDDVGVPSVVRQLDELTERVEDYGGRIVKSTGDGLLLTFESPRQAVSFSLAAQRALVGSVPRVRIGMNIGEAEWHEGDPLGAAVNAAARIAARADGGEVLVSDVVRQLTVAVGAFHFRGSRTPPACAGSAIGGICGWSKIGR